MSRKDRTLRFALYDGDLKQPPTVTDGDVNVAMHAAPRSLRRDWPAIVSVWETTR